jgi:type IV secretion system protein VirD4
VFTHRQEPTPVAVLLFVALIIMVIAYGRKKRISSGAYGTAAFCVEAVLRYYGMLGAKGLVLGRTVTGKLIRIRTYVHILLRGGSGSGKGVSICIPNLLDYCIGGLAVFDPKNELFAIAKKLRKVAGRMIRFAPFNGGEDYFNPLDTIPAESPLLIDSARAMAEALVVRQGTEPEAHWNDSAVEGILGILVFVLIRLQGTERSLNSVAEIAADPMTLLRMCYELKAMGGIFERLGNKIKRWFDKDNFLTKEGTGILNTIGRHLAFLDSPMVANALSRSTFRVEELLVPGNACFISIPGDQLEAQRGLIRCIISTLIRVIGSSGHEEDGEVLFLLDEASALGGLTAIKEALVRGRSAGVRLLLAYQSVSQVEAAFPQEKTLIQDNVSAQIWLLPPGSYETAERISKMCGDYTQWVEGHGTNEGWSYSSDGKGGGSSSRSGGSSVSFSQQPRALFRAEEILVADPNMLIANIRGLPGPVLCDRIKYYKDPFFNGEMRKEEHRRWKDRLSQWEFPSKLGKALFWTAIFVSCWLLIAYWADSSQSYQPMRWNLPSRRSVDGKRKGTRASSIHEGVDLQRR